MVSGRRACRAGPSPSIGAPTASRSGATPNSWPGSTSPPKKAKDEAKDERKPGAITPKAAEAFATALVARLGVDSSYIIPAYEDPLHRIREEAALPINIDPSDPKIDDPEERGRIIRDFERGLSTPTGFVLPIQRWNAPAARTGWVSGHWPLRRGKLFLAPAIPRWACGCR